MDNIEIFQIDAFTDKIFHGNPAAVCLMTHWLNDELLQAIAVENNLSETAFVIQNETGFDIRWFAPDGEMSLCGHATLAAGFVLFELGKQTGEVLTFSSLSGNLSVTRKNDLYTLNFPRLSYKPCQQLEMLADLIDKEPLELYESELDYLILLADEEAVSQAHVDLKLLGNLDKRGLILTAASTNADFYSRCFYPRHKIAEDPVTGSAHCVLAPFWANRLNKTNLRAIQGSFRKGEILCDVIEDRVNISGYCKWYSRGILVI